MPRSKKAKAAKMREAAKKLARQSAQALLYPFSLNQLPNADTPDLNNEGTAIPLEPIITISVKQEPEREIEVNPFEAEVKVEPLEPATEGEELDPIGAANDEPEEFDQKHFELAPLDPHDPRCQFCLKPFRESGGQGIISRKRIVFVLGERRWGSPREHPRCCNSCKQLFELFYEFKRSCLVALTRPELLLASLAKTERHEVPVLEGETTFKWIQGSTEKTEVEDPESHPQDMEQRNEGLGVDFQEKKIEENQVSQFLDDDTDDKQDRTENYSDWESEKSYPDTGDLSSKEGHTKRQNKKPKDSTRKYCFRCKKFYETEAVYWEHKPSCTRPPRDPPPLACPQCPKRFNRQEQLMYHVNQHNGIRTVPCRREGCTKMFFRPSVRQRHELFCGKDPQIMCTMCAAIFRSSSALAAHMATHGDPTYICEVCNKGFYTKASLQKHAPAHSGERKFECKVCGKRFKSYEANRVHQRIHTQEKPYICPNCGMAFMYNCILKTHLQKGQCVGQVSVGSARQELAEATSSMEMQMT
ncbi:AAEL011904-PA [Aedes aegypti]|uniref:AAEL011904-PA n=1 Tax=Aedes aegypti TaxID=7159 RepID=Q16NN8_AEDAE|nr:AAEL011904-PA [Aedes aegypti]